MKLFYDDDDDDDDERLHKVVSQLHD